VVKEWAWLVSSLNGGNDVEGPTEKDESVCVCMIEASFRRRKDKWCTALLLGRKVVVETI
jgi:hypothetical protein